MQAQSPGTESLVIQLAVTKMSFKGNKDKVNLSPKVQLQDEVILITGGSGFLGQHIVRVLQERAEGLKEIRIADTTPYIPKLPFQEKFPIKFYSADVTIEAQLDEPFDGATAVIHCAASIQVGHYVDRERSRDVNVNGTSNVVNKCQEWNVPKLVLTSTVDALIKKDSNFYDQGEEGLKLPTREEDCLIGSYAFTKALSEEVVRGRKILANGNDLKTTILRPTVIYGELDPYYVPEVLRTAKVTWGYLPKPSCLPKGAVLQGTYAGNVAWAHVLAVTKLREELLSSPDNKSQKAEVEDDTSSVNGKVLFVTDDTPPEIMYDFMVPFLEVRGFSLVQLPLPLFMLAAWVWLVSSLIRLFPDSWKRCAQANPVLPTYESFQMVHKMVHFSRARAIQCLNYSPIYGSTQAMELSAEYYKGIVI
ncbi:unnamed protein product [Allacma fusca]|uniref:3-beta hydroxysteroid dehydrogenase/isomerase domain-containing protein n=1 Tax=Allacma fusca TaxID=39272 RepID=A0A8J2J7D4_9HEXA|nr:unnamed protein product [Allacma fusca]